MTYINNTQYVNSGDRKISVNKPKPSTIGMNKETLMKQTERSSSMFIKAQSKMDPITITSKTSPLNSHSNKYTSKMRELFASQDNLVINVTGDLAM